MRGIDFNDNWKFRLADKLELEDTSESGMGWQPYANDAEQYYFAVHMDEEDSNWRKVRLPHDWSVEFPFDLEKGEGCTGYLLGGIGWYRKYFKTTEDMVGKKVIINFDGIYNRSNIYCNNQFIKFHPYGYSPCLIDISEYLKPVGEENIISVKVDHSRYADSRWYTGSGIYRKVSMHILERVNIPVWGLYFTSPVITSENAIIHGEIEVENGTSNSKRVLVKTSIIDPNGIEVAKKNSNVSVEPHNKSLLKLELIVKKPILWDIDATNMYQVKVQLVNEDRIAQEEYLKIGLRTSEFDPEKGFFLNGKSTLIKGVCLHHDAGIVGAAVPNDVWRRRLELLKACGCNAIRTAHNPYSEEFFDLCDEIGFLVQEEFYDEWDYAKDKRWNCADRKCDYISRGHVEFFKHYAKEDLQAVMKRDRNHPCIFQWSLGNEIEWGYPQCDEYTGYFHKDSNAHWAWDLPPYSPEKIQKMIAAIPEERYSLRKTANQLANWTREMDLSRHVTSNCVMPASSHLDGYTDALDVVGYSHRHMLYDYGHENYPDKPIMGCESGPTWFQWKATEDRDFISGMFMWTGIDYLGEADYSRRNIYKKGSGSGIIDFAGFPKTGWHVFKTWWEEEAYIFANTSKVEESGYMLDENNVLVEREKDIWKQPQRYKEFVNEHWNYGDNELVLIEAYSNCEDVTLLVNGKVVSTQYSHNSIDKAFRWIVPYKIGNITVIGKKDGEECNYQIHTTGALSEIVLESDKLELTTDYDCVSHLVVTLHDEKGQSISNKEENIEFFLEGPYINMGVDNGAATNFQAFQSNHLCTNKGKALMIIQGAEKGTIKVTATVGGIKSNTVEINVI